MSIVDEISEHLKRKQQIDQAWERSNNMSDDPWILHALELLLRIALEQEMQRERDNA
jgi:hypothetical protein